MSSSDTAISVRGLSKSYTIAHDQEKHSTLAETVLARLKNPLRRPKSETFWALKDVNFEIKKGDVVGIIGRNGAGKSTLLKVLSRITEPTTGEIDIYGRVGSLLEVGTGFHPELTGRENVYLNGAILGMSKDEIRTQFDAIVDFAGVEKFLDTPVKRYSSGMYVRLAFSVAAHLNPEILIVDEVLAVGDGAFQKKCIGKMQDAAGAGRTVLFVSHNIGVLKSLCKSAIALRDGRVVEQGPAKQVIEAYSAGGVDVTRHKMDVSTMKRISGIGERLHLLEVDVNDGRPIHHGDSIEFKLTYNASDPLNQVAFGVGITTTDGVRLMTMDSDQSAPFFDIERGRDTTSVSVKELWLEPGIYAVSIGVRTGHLSALDHVENCGHFEILPSQHSTAVSQSDQDGGVRPPAVWIGPQKTVRSLITSDKLLKSPLTADRSANT